MDPLPGAATRAGIAPPPSITVCPDGPYLVRGDVQIRTATGEVVERGPGTVALCRCGKSARAPFCDGTHKMIARTARGDAASERPSAGDAREAASSAPMDRYDAVVVPRVAQPGPSGTTTSP